MTQGDHKVALTGRVYCWCDASFGPIEVGSMLTTSATPGHAMKATDRDKAFGAVIGKAMTELKTGKVWSWRSSVFSSLLDPACGRRP